MKNLSNFEQMLAEKVAVRLLVILAAAFVLFTVLAGSPKTSFLPFLTAAAVTIESGILAMSGVQTQPAWGIFHISSLLSLLFYYILMPWMFIKALQNWVQLSAEVRKTAEARMPLWIHIVSSGFIGMMLLGSWYLFIAGKGMETRIPDANRIDTQSSLFIERINCVALQAQNYYFLPVANDGGGRTFLPVTLPDGTLRQFTVNEAPFKRSLLPGRKRGVLHMNDVTGKFLIQPVSTDTMITIVAVSNISSADSMFANADGGKGKREWQLTVYPHNHIVRLLNP